MLRYQTHIGRIYLYLSLFLIPQVWVPRDMIQPVIDIMPWYTSHFRKYPSYLRFISVNLLYSPSSDNNQQHSTHWDYREKKSHRLKLLQTLSSVDSFKIDPLLQSREILSKLPVPIDRDREVSTWPWLKIIITKRHKPHHTQWSTWKKEMRAGFGSTPYLTTLDYHPWILDRSCFFAYLDYIITLTLD
jgi:hypothetical protein